MRTSIFTFTQTGNTLKVAQSIAIGLESHGIQPEMARYSNRTECKPDDYELIGIGCPVHDNRPAKCMVEYIKKSATGLKAKKVFVFITSESSPAKSLWRLSRVLENVGAEVIGGIQIRGMSTFPTIFGIFPNRPDADDLRIAERFGAEIADRITINNPMSSDFVIDKKKGGVFYDHLGPFLISIKKLVTPAPKIDEGKCILCGICVSECPEGNLAIENGTIKVDRHCGFCYRCWHICPKEAVEIKHSPGNGIIEHFLYSEKMARRFGNLKPDEVYGENLFKDVIERKIKLKYNKENPTVEFEFKDKM
jgi:flavodoxin/Pyruvate/2-oxoacid:ferredoxin oxidoreductase delta subunit